MHTIQRNGFSSISSGRGSSLFISIPRAGRISPSPPPSSRLDSPRYTRDRPLSEFFSIPVAPIRRIKRNTEKISFQLEMMDKLTDFASSFFPLISIPISLSLCPDALVASSRTESLSLSLPGTVHESSDFEKFDSDRKTLSMRGGFRSKAVAPPADASS